MINKIMTSVINNGVKRPLNWVANTKFMNGVCKDFQDKNLKRIGGLAVASIALKDGFGCYLYVKQSLNNKDIPDDKRKFVAALDLANGGLMVLSQLAAFWTVSNEKFQAKMFDGLFKKKFVNENLKNIFKKITEKQEFKNISVKEFNAAFDKFHGNVKSAFGLLTSLVASTILAKRVLVPFIATPLAEQTKKLLGGKEDKAKEIAYQDTFTANKK